MQSTEEGVEANIDEYASDDGSTRSKASKKKAPKTPEVAASFRETWSFAFDEDKRTIFLLIGGVIGGIGNGLVYPLIIWIFTRSFGDIAGASVFGLGPINEICYWMVGIGVYALIMSSIQTTCFEAVAAKAAENFRMKWFYCLLRQDQAFYDVYDVVGIATSIAPQTNNYRRGVGRKFGEGVEFMTCAIGGVILALTYQWKVALVVLCTCPLVAAFAMGVVKINQTKTSRATQAYVSAGSVAYATISGIKTVLSLNAAPIMVEKYKDATSEAFHSSVRPLIAQGFVTGGMFAAFMFMYVVNILYGCYLIALDIMDTGCDPSGVVPDNEVCAITGMDVFGALFGIAIAGQGISQVGTILENFAKARVAAGQALMAINRKPGQPEEKIYHVEDEKDDNDDSGSVTSSRSSNFMIETPEGRIKAILPPYEIDALSDKGLKPEHVEGKLTFEEVQFSYPSRPGQTVLNGLTIDIPAGKTIAFVGPSGGGKSTVVKLLERFYDPTDGAVKLDGTDIKEINVHHLRSMIGYVGQEPTLFATTIRQNISFGCPGCTQEQIEEAAKQANAHDFIMQLPDGYDTEVGDRGSQLSGGQKQRIAIARVLVGDPKILLLDEATSALDSQSELVVQEALEKIISTKKRTTVIIAHRLSTIRNADIIAVVMGGTIVETGTHKKLMKKDTYYKKLVEAQGQSAMTSKRKSSIMEVDAMGQTESQRGFNQVPKDFVDMDADPLIVFRNVTFTYPSRPDKVILDRFKLKIYRGETIGLCGISGGGKSTIMGLIERFYDPDDGSVEYFGENVQDLNVKWYRDQIGYVGQEPTLFDATIAQNIAYGAPGATRDEIIEAAKQANAYDFIMNFPDGFDTPISGGSATQLSGGQKQRVAIARAIIKQPEILLLDEATSALDNESERIVQQALDKLMESRDRTCIVIAHRLSTIRNADRIAFIGDGRVKEIGSHDELMEKSNGKYKRLVESQGRKASTLTHGFEKSKKKKKKKNAKDEAEETDVEDFGEELEKEEEHSFDLARARKLATPDAPYLLVGALGALMAGSVFPAWGVMFAEMIVLMVYQVPMSDDQDIWDAAAENYRQESYTISLQWLAVMVVALVGNIVLFWGFGQASERMTKRLRDDAFKSLLRQEVAFFDKRDVGRITSELAEDATRIQSYTGDPIRQFLMSLSSMLAGIVVALVFMWPFALIAFAVLPIMGWANSMEIQKTMGEDEGDEKVEEDASTPAGVIAETLSNIGTVSALTMEEDRFNHFEEILNNSENNYVRDGFKQGALSGLSILVQQWVTALEFWVGAWLLTKYPETFNFRDLFISLFSFMFGIFGLGMAFQDMADKKETEKSASRIFFLLDRQSDIDPLSEEGKTIDTSIPRKSKSKRKSSVKKPKSSKKKRVSSLRNVEEEDELEEDYADEGHRKSSSKKKKKSKRSSKKLLDDENEDDTDKKPKSDGKKSKKKKKSKD